MVRIVLDGELDLSAKDALTERLHEATDADVAVIDLSRVTYLDSTAIHCFIELKNRMIGRGHAGVVKLLSPHDRIRKIFELCDLNRLFPIV